MAGFTPEVQAAALELVQHLLKRQDNATEEPAVPALEAPPNTYNHGDTAFIMTCTVRLISRAPIPTTTS